MSMYVYIYMKYAQGSMTRSKTIPKGINPWV